MLKIEDIDKVKNSFYGWEYCVENGLTPTITAEDIELLMNVFIDLEEKDKRINELMLDVKYQTDLQQKTATNLTKCRRKLADIKIILNT